MASAVTCFSGHSVADLPEEYNSEQFSAQLLSNFKEFRDEELFCDFVLKVENREFKVRTVKLLSDIFLNAIFGFFFVLRKRLP